MNEDEREARRLWYATCTALLAASVQATLDGDGARAADLEVALKQMKGVGDSVGWKPVDAFREIYS